MHMCLRLLISQTHMHLLLTKCINWQSDLIGKDSQQDPPSLTFAHPEQIAKFIGC